MATGLFLDRAQPNPAGTMANYDSIERQEDAFPTTPVGDDASEAKGPRRRNMLAAAYTLLACSGALYLSQVDSGSAGITSLASDSSSPPGLVIRDTDKVGVDSGGNYSCNEYDDDGTFTPDLCSGYDWDTCFGGTRGHVNKTNCNSSFWCNTFCADMCEDGAGAMCYYEMLSDLNYTCSRVKRILHSKNYLHRRQKWEEEHLGKEWGDDMDDYIDVEDKKKIVKGGEELIFMPMPDTTETTEATQVTETTQTTEATEATLIGNGVNDDLSDEGCGRHVYCHYCTGDCESDDMVTWIHDKYYDRVSPYSTKQAIIDIEQVCYSWGYLPHKGDDDI